MKRIIAGVALVMNTASFSSADAVCIYADRQYSEGATLCISLTATQNAQGRWHFLHGKREARASA